MSAVPDGVYSIQSASIPANNLRRLQIPGETIHRAVTFQNTSDTWRVRIDSSRTFCTITHVPSVPDIVPHVLDLNRQNTTPGTAILVHSNNNSIAQRWRIIRAIDSGGRLSFQIAYHAQPTSVISANGTGSMVHCQIAARNATARQQQWFFNPA